MAKEMNKAKERYTSFERQDIQLQEDAKHLKGQIKKLTAGISKVSYY